MTKSSPDASTAGILAWQPPDLRTVSAPSVGGLPAAGPTVEEAAFQRGYAQGQADYAEAREHELSHVVGGARAAVHALETAADTLRSQLATTVHALAIAIARHLVERELTQSPIDVQKLVEKALTLAPTSGPVVVRLNPGDLAALQEIGGTAALATTALELRWTGDATISRGSCLVETAASVIDGRVDRALLDLYERLGHE
ncbi:MAG: FliH/SctL family protein [Gemmatimonadales bacterium]